MNTIELVIAPGQFLLSKWLNSYVKETTWGYGFDLSTECCASWYWLCDDVRYVLLVFTKTTSEFGVCHNSCDILRFCCRLLASLYALQVVMVFSSKITFHCVQVSQNWFQGHSVDYQVLSMCIKFKPHCV